MSGVVFHHISEGVMAQNLKLRVEDACDSTSIMTPEVKNGNILAADYILRHLNIRSNGGLGHHQKSCMGKGGNRETPCYHQPDRTKGRRDT